MKLQTPILVSLVKKDAAMLDAFGKGASEDIQASKEVLYRNLTRNPETGESMCGPSKIGQKSLPVSPNQVHPDLVAVLCWVPCPVVSKYDEVVLPFQGWMMQHFSTTVQ